MIAKNCLRNVGEALDSCNLHNIFCFHGLSTRQCAQRRIAILVLMLTSTTVLGWHLVKLKCREEQLRLSHQSILLLPRLHNIEITIARYNNNAL